MRLNQGLSNPYVHHISHILPISYHSNFSSEMEYSDKIILPLSILLTIKKIHLPLPPVFSLGFFRENYTPVICGVLEFTAEENHLYSPNWIIKKLGKKSKYSNGDALLEILRAKNKNNYTFPLLKKIEIYTEWIEDIEELKKALSMYTVVNKGESINIIINDRIYRVNILNLLPKNKCIIRNTAFEVILANNSTHFITSEQQEDIEPKPIIKSIPISLSINKSHKKRNSDAYTPWEHRIQPIKIDSEGIHLLPWGKEETRNENTQTLPDIVLLTPKPRLNFKSKPRKILTLAFPEINMPDQRPLTSLDIEIKYKSITSSPRRYTNQHKNSVY
jgi:Ubiquitin fusion degradation protein UFD1